MYILIFYSIQIQVFNENIPNILELLCLKVLTSNIIIDFWKKLEVWYFINKIITLFEIIDYKKDEDMQEYKKKSIM